MAVLVAWLKGRFGGQWLERLGLASYPPLVATRKRYCLHGASVGEARSLANIITSLLELEAQAEVFLFIGTPAGLAVAKDIFAHESRVKVMAPPLDFWGAPKRVFTKMNPAAFLILETELWPNLLLAAQKKQIPTMLAAGSISERSFNRYLRIRDFMAEILNSFKCIAPISSADSERFQALGASPKRLEIMGNPKFDLLLKNTESPDFTEQKALWSLRLWADSTPYKPLIVAASTHQGEDEIIIKAFKELRKKHQAHLLLAPRHLKRTGQVATLAQTEGLSTVISHGEAGERGLATNYDVIVLNALGHLQPLYAISSVSLVGGSFLPHLQGHNPLEPAAVGRAPLFGPFMSSFQDEATGLLAAGGAFASSAETLSNDLISSFSSSPAQDLNDNGNDQAQSPGSKARAYLLSRPQVAPALARKLCQIAKD